MRANQYGAPCGSVLPHRLVQRRDLVIELFAALVETAAATGGDFAHLFDRDRRAAVLPPRRDPLRSRASPNARRASPSPPCASATSASSSMARARLPSPAPGVFERTAQHLDDVRHSERAQHVDADSDNNALMTSKEGFSVVAPMNVSVPSSTYGRKVSCCALLKRCTSSKQHGAAPASARTSARTFNGFADILDPGHDGRELHEFRVGAACNQPCERGLARAWRAPEVNECS